MELRWDSPETMTIPNVGSVRQGGLFTIDDPRGRDLIDRGLASLPVVQQGQSGTFEEPRKQKSMGLTQVDAIPTKKE